MELIVAGSEGKENRIYCHCPPKPTGHVVFFLGDTQDLKSVMEEQHYDISQWSPWCIEETCNILKGRFPTSAVWIIRPHTLLRHLFSCYHNFVESSIVGVPTFSTEPKAIPHLYHLLYNATLSLSEMAQLDSHTSFLHLPLTLIGFSKGCVVPNQIIHELGNYMDHSAPPYKEEEGSTEIPYKEESEVKKLPYKEKSEVKKLPYKEESNKELPNKEEERPTPLAVQEASMKEDIEEEGKILHNKESACNMKELMNFVHQIKAMYFLDSGHSGEFGCWVTDREILKPLAVLNPEIHVHVTPYQMKHPQRMWIADEEIQFVSTLNELGMTTVNETDHFNEEPRTFLNHFKILNLF